MHEQGIAQAAEILRSAQRVVAFTGAGVSAESGVPTFRGSGGLWEGHPVEELASPHGFFADPVKVWRFYEERRRNLAHVRPNPAHRVLACWHDRFPRYTIVTQNVDGLHQDAGARGVLELHGSIWHVRCLGCGRDREERTVPLPQVPPLCSECGAMERPAVVWYGELLPEMVMAASFSAIETCDVLVVVGTSAVVYPAAGFVEVATTAGAKVMTLAI
jgi:NAD-dependent deacetylase